MASVTISGGGSIPSRSRAFTSDDTPEGHLALFIEINDFVSEWHAATSAADAAAALGTASEQSSSTPTDPA